MSQSLRLNIPGNNRDKIARRSIIEWFKSEYFPMHSKIGRSSMWVISVGISVSGELFLSFQINKFE